MSELTGVGGEVLGSSSPRLDVVAGWNFKIQNLSAIDTAGLIPFVQLIGLYSDEEINRLVTHSVNYDTDASRVVFVEQGGQEKGLYDSGGTYEQIGQAATEDHERFAEKLRSKYIDVNITDQNNRDTNTFIPGIVLATNVPQAGSDAYEYYSGTNMPKDSGGVGITDLQIETGTKEFMNRRYKLRLTVTDPQALNDNPEYLKLTSLQSKFLIIHGWSNLHELGAPGLAPPIIEPDPSGNSNGRMYVDITQQNTGGMWSAATVATTMFDFAFNEVGQLEASFTFMPREISFLATYTLPTISRTYRRFLGTGEKTQINDAHQIDKPPTQFAGFAAGLFAAGSEFGKNLADIISEEQNAYNRSNPSLESVGGLFDFIDTSTGFNAADALRNWSEESIPFDGSSLALIDDQKQREGRRRFPHAGPGIRVYTKSKRRVQDPQSRESTMGQDEFEALNRTVDGEPAEWPADMTEEERNRGTMQVTDYKTHLKYYYLGWLMEAARFSLWDLNKTKAARGETPYNVRFRYMKIPQQSAFNASFHEELNTGLVPDVNKFVSESLNFLKSNCFPGYGIVDPRDLWAQNDAQRNGLTMRPMTEWDLTVGWPDSIDRDSAYLDTQGTATFQPNNSGYASASLHRMQKRLNFYGIIGTLGEGMFAVGADGETEWDRMSPRDKKRRCAGENWRHSLAIDPAHDNALRIMLPPYAGQLLYTYKHPAPLVGYDDENPGSGAMFPSWRDNQDDRVLGDILGTYVNSWDKWGLMLLPDFKEPDYNGNRGILTYGDHGSGPLHEGKIRYYNDVFTSVRFNMVLAYRVKIHPGYSLNSNVRNASMMQDPTRYVGDPTESREYGLLMPAQNARFYSGEYVANQRRWYNKHIQYLSNKFEKIVGDRIQEAISSGKTIQDIAAEPVDLYRLTGRIYWPNAFQDVFRKPGQHTGYGAAFHIFNENNPSERLREQEYASESQYGVQIRTRSALASSVETDVNWNIELNNANPFRLEAITSEYDYYKSTYAAEEILLQLGLRGVTPSQIAVDEYSITTTAEFQGQQLYFKTMHGETYVYGNEQDALNATNPLLFVGPEDYRARDDLGFETSWITKQIPVNPPGRVTDYNYGAVTSDVVRESEFLEQDVANRLQKEFTSSYSYSDVNAELQNTIDEATAELALEDENNTALFGSPTGGPLLDMYAYYIQSVDAQEDQATKNMLDFVEGGYAHELGAREGLSSVLSFWNERLNRILVELYNKDLIDLPPENIATIPGSKTDATDWSTTNASYEGRPNRERIESTTARTFSNLKLYEVKWFSNDQNALINVPADAKTRDDVRLLVEGFVKPVVSLEYDDGYLKKINLQNINDIAGGATAEGANNIGYLGYTQDNYVNNTWPIDGVALQYIFLNYSEYWLPGSAGNMWLNGRKYIEDSPLGLKNEAANLIGYLSKVRSMIRGYLVNISSLESQISELSIRRNNIIRVRDEAIAALEVNAITNKILGHGSSPVSPFTGSLPLDENFIIHKGGGRKVELNSLVALSWEQRFRRWEVRGAPDIMNYGPKKGGVAYGDKEKRFWGWHTDKSKNVEEELSRHANLSGKANLGDWGAPKSILDIEALRTQNNYEWYAPWTDNQPGQFLMQGEFLDDKSEWRKGSLHPYQHRDWETGEIVENIDEYTGERWRSFHLDEGQPNILIHRRVESGIRWAGMTVGDINVMGACVPWGTIGQSYTATPGKSNTILSYSYASLYKNTPIRVKHLVRAGLVNVALINEILSAKFGWSSVGFERKLSENVIWTSNEWQEYQKLLDAAWNDDDTFNDEGYEAASEYQRSVNNRGIAEKIILGYWPLSLPILSYDRWRNEDFDVARETPIEPYYLVDQDLDFVEPAYRQAISGPAAFQGVGTDGERHLAGLDPLDWVKVNRADCLFAPESNYHLVMYPQSHGYRIGVDEHIPGLPKEAVRQLVNVPGRVVGDGIYQSVFRDYAKGGDTTDGGGNNLRSADFEQRGLAEWAMYSNVSFVPEFATNASISDVGTEGTMQKPYRAGMHADNARWNPSIASIKGTFTSQGYVAYNSIFPFGIPYLNDEWKAPVGYPTAGGMQTSKFGKVTESQYYPFYTGGHALTVHETLHNLPPEFEDGFFSSVVGAGADFTGGTPLNDSLSDFIAENIFSLLPGGRQIGVHNNIAQWGREATNDSLHQYEGFEIRDVTYGDLLDNVLGNRETTTANFATQRIDSVAEIPIKREVVDNLLKPNNQNTSLLRFFQQIMSPSAIGLPGNVQLGVRNNNGLVEIFPASISYRGQTTDMFKEAAEAEERANQPENQLLFNYRVKNSLIESIDMSSKMDPAAFLTYQNSSDLLRGRDFNVLKLLSYEGVALEFKEFLEGTLNVDGSGETYSGIISSDASRKIKIDKVRFDGLPGSVLDAFVSQDPERWAKITATMQGNENFTTELLAFYMRGVSLVIHGITNLQPFNLIHVTGVMPDLEGIYIITNLTEKVTPTAFQTIIEGKLLKRKRISEGKFI